MRTCVIGIEVLVNEAPTNTDLETDRSDTLVGMTGVPSAAAAAAAASRSLSFSFSFSFIVRSSSSMVRLVVRSARMFELALASAYEDKKPH